MPNNISNKYKFHPFFSYWDSDGYPRSARMGDDHYRYTIPTINNCFNYISREINGKFVYLTRILKYSTESIDDKKLRTIVVEYKLYAETKEIYRRNKHGDLYGYNVLVPELYCNCKNIKPGFECFEPNYGKIMIEKEEWMPSDVEWLPTKCKIITIPPEGKSRKSLRFSNYCSQYPFIFSESDIDENGNIYSILEDSDKNMETILDEVEKCIKENLIDTKNFDYSKAIDHMDTFF